MLNQLRIQVTVMYRNQTKGLTLCADVKDRGMYTNVKAGQIVSDMIKYYIDNKVLDIPDGEYELYIHIPSESSVLEVGEKSPVKVLLVTNTPAGGFIP